MKFFSRGSFYYFNRMNGHYYRYVSNQEAQASTRSEMADFARKLIFAGSNAYLATFAGYGISPYQQGDGDHEYTFILQSGILSDNKGGKRFAPIALTSGLRCDASPTQAQILQGSCASATNRGDFYWLPGKNATNQDLSNLRRISPQSGNPWYPDEPNGSGNILVTAGWSTEQRSFQSKYRMLDVIITNSFAGGAISNEGITPNGELHNLALMWDDIPDKANYFDGAILEYGANEYFNLDGTSRIERTILITGSKVSSTINPKNGSSSSTKDANSSAKRTSTTKAKVDIRDQAKKTIKPISVKCIKGIMVREFSSKSCPPGWRTS